MRKNVLTRSKKSRAMALLHANLFEEAARLFEEICRVDPMDAESWRWLGMINSRLGALARAEECCRKALSLRPDDAEAHNVLGNVLSALERDEEAVACYRNTIRLQPHDAQAYNNLANALVFADRGDEAIECYKTALKYDPNYAEAYSNLAAAYAMQRRYAEAIESHQTALRLNPGSAEAHHNLGLVFTEQGSFKEAETHYRMALQLKPGYAAAYSSLALLELLQGRFESAWHHYVHRPSIQSKGAVKLPSALPLDLTGKRLLLMRDQGLGDEIFFLRFVPQLKARGAWVAYCPNPKLAALLARVPQIDRIVARGEPLKDLTYTISVSDLPLLLGMDHVSKIPPPLPLPVPPQQLETMRQRLAQLGPPPYVGVTWRAGTKDKRKLYKEAPLAALAEVLKPFPVTILILQRHPHAGEVEYFSKLLGRPAPDLSALNEDLEEMFVLLAQIDDYMGVSNTNMHLRAATGKTARVLLPHPPEWRWMAEGEESPWFRGFAVYRQGMDCAWDEAFGRLAQDLLHTFPSA